MPVKVAVQEEQKMAPPFKAELLSKTDEVSVNGDDVSWKIDP